MTLRYWPSGGGEGPLRRVDSWPDEWIPAQQLDRFIRDHHQRRPGDAAEHGEHVTALAHEMDDRKIGDRAVRERRETEHPDMRAV
jgi:hypothetical protein